MQQYEEARAGELLSLSVPRGWQQRSLVAFTNGSDGPEGASIVVRTEPVDPRTSVAQYTDTLLVELARTLPGFALLARRQCEIGGLPGHELEFTWMAQGVCYQQIHACVQNAPGHIVCIITSAAQQRNQLYGDVFASVLRGISFTPAPRDASPV